MSIRIVVQPWLRVSLLLLVIGLVGHAKRGPRASAQSESNKIYLPVILKQGCSPTVQEQDIANRMKTDPNQQRPALNCHSILEQVARARAQDMGMRAYFSHVNPDGFGPNYLVQQAGYVLPSWYDQSLSANNIESIAAGYSTTDAVWQGWMNSSGHRTHILGLDPFWAEQTDYGIGYAYVSGSPYGHY